MDDNISIILANNDNIDETMAYIDSSSKESPFSFVDAKSMKEDWQKGHALVATCLNNNVVIGGFVFTIKYQNDLKYLVLNLFHGRDMKIWRDEFVKFIFKLAEANECTDFYMLGRKGWGRLFPEMEHIACVYGHKFDSTYNMP